MARLAPKPDVVKMLLAWSGNRCAFPGCNHIVINEFGKFVAEVCHIEGVKGERFNPNQSDEERRDASNLIILCHQHHVETDDVISYPVDRMKDMKAQHEGRFKTNPYLPPASLDIVDILWQITKGIVDSNKILSETVESQQGSIATLSDLLAARELERGRLSEEILRNRNYNIELERKYHDLTTEAKEIREQLNALRRLYPATFRNELEEEERAKTLEQLSREADYQTEQRQKLEQEEQRGNAGIKIRLGNQLESIFKFTEALAAYRTAIKLWPENLTIVARIANLLNKIGHQQEAILTLDPVLKLRDLDLKEYDFQIHAWNSMGQFLLDLNRTREAIPCFELAIFFNQDLIGRAVLVGDVMYTDDDDARLILATRQVMLFNNLGAAHLLAQNLEAATYFLNDSLKTTKLLYGEESVETACGLNNIGDLLLNQGELEESRVYLEKAVEIFNKNKVFNGTLLPILQQNLSKVHLHLNNLESALDHANSSLLLRKEMFGSRSFQTARSYLQVGRVYKSMEENEKALENFEMASEIYLGEPVEGNIYLKWEMKLGVKDSFSEIADHLIDVQNYAESLRYLELLKNLFTVDHGEKSAEVAGTLFRIGLCYGRMKKIHEAIAIWSEAKTIFGAIDGFQKEVDIMDSNISHAKSVLDQPEI